MIMVLELTEIQKERLRRYAAQQGKAPQTLLLEWVNAIPELPETTKTQTEIKPPFPNLVAYIAPDFDDPLPDEFWLGNEANDPLNSRESTLSELQEWYTLHCDGDWEHSYGVSIGTLDNPGWCLCIDLEGTGLEDVAFTEVKENYDDALDWLICVKHEGKFSANGGPRKLEPMISVFLAWAKTNGK